MKRILGSFVLMILVACGQLEAAPSDIEAQSQAGGCHIAQSQRDGDRLYWVASPNCPSIVALRVVAPRGNVIQQSFAMQNKHPQLYWDVRSRELGVYRIEIFDGGWRQAAIVRVMRPNHWVYNPRPR